MMIQSFFYDILTFNLINQTIQPNVTFFWRLYYTNKTTTRMFLDLSESLNNNNLILFVLKLNSDYRIYTIPETRIEIRLITNYLNA